MKIQIVSGTYGYMPIGKTVVTPISAKDPPIEVSDAEAQRLVKRKVAVRCEDLTATAVATPQGGAGAGVPSGNTPCNGNGAEPPQSPQENPIYSINMKPAQLIALTKQYGLPYKVGTTKLDMVKGLDACFAAKNSTATVDGAGANDDDIDTGEQPPIVTAEDPVT